jgi:dipeptidyl aminopeptidase/acylaminoacyl peptidase
MKKGALYKPENFDASKNYPVIVYYYELKSACVNTYFVPRYCDGDINIPYFVSQGYLVFMPDIHYRVGEIGESALSSIAGAYNYLARQPFVNPSKIGLSGHSFGGFETNYTITHSNLFAAACSDAGPSNFVSQTGFYELSNGSSLQKFGERGQTRMGVTLWEKPDLYLNNSSVLMAHKVTTPVLIVSNKKDAIVHFEQGVQFFTALRRLGKKTWLLQYDGEAHSVLDPKNQRDLTIRMTQFFDHYLKAAAAPVWMTKGVEAKYKGIRTGFEIDKENPSPVGDLLTPEAKKTAEKIMNRQPIRVLLK